MTADKVLPLVNYLKRVQENYRSSKSGEFITLKEAVCINGNQLLPEGTKIKIIAPETK